MEFKSPTHPCAKTQGLYLKLGTTRQGDLKSHAMGKKCESFVKNQHLPK